jgi:hypothetical protein
METRVIDNSIEVKVPRGDVILLATSAVLCAALAVAAGWQVAAVALTLSIAGGTLVSVVQRVADGPRRGA